MQEYVNKKVNNNAGTSDYVKHKPGTEADYSFNAVNIQQVITDR